MHSVMHPPNVNTLYQRCYICKYTESWCYNCVESSIKFYSRLLCLGYLRQSSFHQCMLQKMYLIIEDGCWDLDYLMCSVFNTLHLQQSKSCARHVVIQTWCSDMNYATRIFWKKNLQILSRNQHLSSNLISLLIIAVRSIFMMAAKHSLDLSLDKASKTEALYLCQKRQC